MPQSSLTVDFAAIKKRVSYFLSYGRTWSTLTSQQQEDVTESIRSGLMRFYYPENQYEWRFMKPTASFVAWPTTLVTATASGNTITATVGTFYPSMVGEEIVYTVSGNSYTISKYVSGTVIEVDTAVLAADTASLASKVTTTADYTLPIDFGAMDGDLTFGESEGYHRITPGSGVRIRRNRQTNTSAGVPQIAAIQVQTGSGDNVQQRHRLMLWPEPDQVYNFEFRYVAHPNMLVSDSDVPLGGPAHGDTIIEACLACAEDQIDDEQGIHAQRFAARLNASIAYDRKTDVEHLGYNGDASSNRSTEQRIFKREDRNQVVTYGGVAYG